LSGGLGIPFGPQNVLPVIFNIKKLNYFFASFIGFIPMFFIWNTIGAGLNQYIKQADNFSFISLLLNKEIYLPIIFFLIVMIISVIIKKKIFDDINLSSGDEISVLINSLGATPHEELFIVANKFNNILSDNGIINSKSYVGRYATSMEMAGMSITILKLDDELEKLLLEEANCPFWY